MQFAGWLWQGITLSCECSVCAEVDELQGEDSEALDGDEDVAAENEETPADAPGRSLSDYMHGQ